MRMSDAPLKALAAALADRYRIVREIGAGGMATVYLAEDLKHQRSVAVKVLDPQLAASVGAERFLREIRITAGLQHPNILTLIDSGEAAGFLYYVMPFADGISLRKRLRDADGALPLDESLLILREILDALAHAHTQGLVHRDVKPENVMLVGRHALVLDFGVAKAVQSAREGDRASRGGEEGALTSVGMSLGTPAYMAPEQAAGDPDVDHRADLYSAGVVAYELLSGKVPFEGRTHEVLAAHVTKDPTPLQQRAPQLPAALTKLVMRCLAKRPEDRPQHAEAVLAELDALMRPAASPSLWGRLEQQLGRAGAIGVVATIGVVIMAGVGALTKQSRDARWVATVAAPEIERLLEASRFDSAFVLHERAAARAPRDTALATLGQRAAWETVMSSTPEGARVEWAAIDALDDWHGMGTTPARMRFPRGAARIRLSLAGQRILVRQLMIFQAPDTVRLPLDATADQDSGMVRVDGGNTSPVMPGLSDIAEVRLDPYRLDRYEVANRDYKRFVDAGGYADAQWWTEPIVVAGRAVPVAQALTRFVDRTGRAGPASWEGGTYPAGADDLPVGGVSWYEANAYARFVGQELPTIFHWERAAVTAYMSVIVPQSVFTAEAPRTVGGNLGMSPFGNFDMAGNVREWVANAFGAQRFILGGGWTDQSYAFTDAYAQDPLDRVAINGFRLMKRAPNDSTPRTAWAPIARQMRDYSLERPVGDDVYRTLAGTYAYDRTPVDVQTVSVDSSNANYTMEQVSIATPYGDERMPVYIYVPRRVTGPRQTVVLFPGSNAFYETQHSRETQYSGLRSLALDAILNSGRIVVWPVYASQYERVHTLGSDAPRQTIEYRDHVKHWVQDASRTLDYLETRTDVDTARIAYYGMSFGGRTAPIMLATDPRFKVAVLSVAGLKMERPRPESDPFNFLPRVRIPVLMLNGEFDHYFPLETSQRPFLATLGTPAAQKKHVVFKGGHSVPRTLFITEALAWLDRYLGPSTR
jgi:dienelactone hydrolase/tRNA A-37 threonylcarbamoyl transferase component Bud32